MDEFKNRIQNTAQSLPYYKTCSEIIKEAKESLTSNAVMNTRMVKTNRPFTPKYNQRILFEERRTERPSSSINFCDVTYEETEIDNEFIHSGENDLKSLPPSRIKLPSLINYQSLTSIEKLSEKFLEIIPDQRETASSPSALGSQQADFSRNGKNWFPLMSNIEDHHKSTTSKTKILEKSTTSVCWRDMEKSIWDNKINEARVILASGKKDTIQRIIAAINRATKRGCKDENIIQLLKRLHNCLLHEQHIRSSSDQHLAKNLILKTVYALIESSNETFLVHVIQIILLLQISGKNLATVCKLIFKISRSDRNDDLFLENNIIGLFVNCLGLATPDDDSEALIYGYGALKFLMVNENILHVALDNGIIQLMALHLKMINLAKTEGSNFPEQTSHVLFQLTGCLRNVANDGSTPEKFVTSGTLSALCRTIRLFISDIDLVVNAARILSILSTKKECCDLITEDEISLHTLLKICKRYPGREDIIVRIMFAIGNILANCNLARFQFFSSSEDTLEVILNLMQFYLEIDLKLSLENTFNKSHSLSVEDVFIKIVRVVANMCLDENVGDTFISSVDFYEKMDDFLNCLLIILRRKTIHESEELVISTMSTLNNLSYYSHPDFRGPFSKRCLDICEALSSQIFSRNEECVLEVSRIYGNLSRLPVVRKYLIETGSLNYIIDWLNSPNKDLLLITTGVLINMMVEKEAKQLLKFKGGLKKLIQNLQQYSEKNWHLGTLICQLIWNFSAGAENLSTILGQELAQYLLCLLIDLLDEDRFFSGFNNHNKPLEYKLWEEFSVVATNILEKMETQCGSE